MDIAAALGRIERIRADSRPETFAFSRCQARSLEPQRLVSHEPQGFWRTVRGIRRSGCQHDHCRCHGVDGAARARIHLGAHTRGTCSPQSSRPTARQSPRFIAIRGACVRARLRGEIRQSPRVGEGDSSPANRCGSCRGVRFASIPAEPSFSGLPAVRKGRLRGNQSHVSAPTAS